MLPTPNRPSTLLLLWLLVIPMLLPGTAGAAQTATTTDQLAAMLPEWHDEASEVLATASATYRLDVTAVPGSGDTAPRLHGRQEVTYTNRTGEPLDEVPFRLYANGPADDDVLTLADVTVDGHAVEPRWSDDRSTAAIPLGAPLAPEATTTIAMAFELQVPVDERSFYGILNVDPERGTWALAGWYPILAGWTAERGWILDPPSAFGDPIFSNIAAYDLTLRTPADWRAVTTGVVTDESTEGDTLERRIVTGPVRDLTMVLDDDFDMVEREVDGTRITSWYQPGDRRVGEAVLDYAAQSLAYFNELIGPYPYATLELAPTDLFGAAGVEFPQLIYMGASYYTPTRDLSVPNSLDFTVAHEVAHQWWYGTVGNNQYDHAFIDEGLTNFMSSEMYFEAMYDADAADLMVQRYLEGPFRSHVTASNDQVVNTPTDAFPSSSAYVFAVYSKAPMGFRAIYHEIGHDAFVEGVRIYYTEHRWEIATPADLLAAFNAAAERDITPLWNHWFEEAAGEDDV